MPQCHYFLAALIVDPGDCFEFRWQRFRRYDETVVLYHVEGRGNTSEQRVFAMTDLTDLPVPW